MQINEKRRTRSGFVMYHDILINQLQYLPPDLFKAVVMAAGEFSINCTMRNEPPLETFDGAAGGAYNNLISAIRRSVFEYARRAAKTKLAKYQKNSGYENFSIEQTAKLSDRELMARGFSPDDIAFFRDETGQYQSDLMSDEVTSSDMNNRTELNRTELNRTELNLNPNLNRTGTERPAETPPLTHGQLMSELTTAGVDIGSANRLISRYGEREVETRLRAWQENGMPGTFERYMRG